MKDADQTPPTAPRWDAVHEHLEAVRKPLQAEIAAYPMPIAGCDAQYNYLLERRDAILREIGRFEAAVKSSPQAAAAFIESSEFIDAEAAARFQAPAIRH